MNFSTVMLLTSFPVAERRNYQKKCLSWPCSFFKVLNYLTSKSSCWYAWRSKDITMAWCYYSSGCWTIWSLGETYLWHRAILRGTLWSVYNPQNALFSLAAFTQQGWMIEAVVCNWWKGQFKWTVKPKPKKTKTVVSQQKVFRNNTLEPHIAKMTQDANTLLHWNVKRDIKLTIAGVWIFSKSKILLVRPANRMLCMSDEHLSQPRDTWAQLWVVILTQAFDFYLKPSTINKSSEMLCRPVISLLWTRWRSVSGLWRCRSKSAQGTTESTNRKSPEIKNPPTVITSYCNCAL